MENNKQQLREALNQFTITGTLKEKNLEVKNDFTDKETGAKYTAIAGELVIKVGDDGEHKIKLFSREKTQAGGISKLFKAYQTVQETYLSMADLAGMPEDEREGKYPTRLTVQGELSVNDYYSNNELHSYPELRGKFVNSVKSEDIEDAAEFDVEMYINKMKKELDKDGIETGRLLLEGIVPGYKGIVSPILFTVTDEYGVANFMESTFRVGDTVLLWGDIINSAITTTKTKSGFGQSKEEVTTTYKNEILIIGGEELVLQNEKAFEPELVKLALAEREIYLAGVKSKGEQKAKQPQRSAGFAKTNSKPTTPPKDRSTDDIPF